MPKYIKNINSIAVYGVTACSLAQCSPHCSRYLRFSLPEYLTKRIKNINLLL